MSPLTLTSETMGERYAQLVQAVNELSDGYFYAGRLGDAVQLPQDALALIKNGDARTADRARLLLQYGKMLSKISFYREARFEEACQVLSQAQQAAEASGDDYLRALTALRLGQAVDYQIAFSGEGDFELVLERFDLAYELFTAAGDAEGQGKAAFNKGLIYQRLGDLDQARDYFDRALDIAVKHDFKYDKSMAIRHIGFLHFAEGDLKAACACAQESLELRQQIGCRILLAPAYHVLGSISIAREEWDTALAHLQEADALAEEMDLKFVRIMTQLSLGEWYKRRNDPQQARQKFQMAQRIAEEAGHGPGQQAAAADLADLAHVYA